MSSVAIITGASQGIGRATAIRLAQDFSSIVLVARNLKNLEETASLLSSNGRSSGCKTVILDLDLSNPASADIIITRTLKELGRIDALINISGAVPQIDLFEMTDEQWDSGLAVKFHGARRLTLRAWDSLKASNGSVVFTSGNSAVAPKASYAAVGTINAAIVALAKAFSDRGIVDGVRVNSVLPGAVMTNRRRAYLEKWAHAHDMAVAEAMEKFPAEAGIRRFGEPEEIAELMAFLVSPGARWMTGSAVRMDGGEIKSV
jgi:3-oxoacyl-[acyl-carrier protein] reductase